MLIQVTVKLPVVVRARVEAEYSFGAVHSVCVHVHVCLCA